MFTATFTISIYNGNTRDSASAVAVFTRTESLPFVPIEEMFLTWSHDTEYLVAKVVWDFDDEVFVCQLADDCHQSIGSADYDIEGLVKHYINTGWTLISETKIERKKSFWEKNP